jgi:endoglycosylceramidase
VRHDWPSYAFAAALGSAVQNLYDDVGGLGAAFAEFWRRAAARFKNNDHVIGYELINEVSNLKKSDAGRSRGRETFTRPRPSFLLLLVFNSHPQLVPGVADKKNLQPFYDRVAAQIRTVDDEVSFRL